MDSAPWLDVVCSWCCDRSDDDRPCSEDCERLAVRAARTRRIVGLVDAIARATKLRRQYVEERIPGDRRIEQVDAIVADYDRQIHEAVTAQQRDDGHDAETLPAPAMLPECDQDAWLHCLLAEDLNAAAQEVS